jgi:DNA-binding MarR family transcriptional regulator
MSDRLDLAIYLPYLVNRRGSALVENFTASALAQHDVNIDAWRVMAVLANQGAQRQIDLAALTSVEVSTLSRLVTRMVRMGLVTRRRSESSNREVVVELAAKGKGLVKRIIPLAHRLERHEAGIPASDMAAAGRARGDVENAGHERRSLPDRHRARNRSGSSLISHVSVGVI